MFDKRTLLSSILLCLTTICIPAFAQKDTTLALTPPMGWNSWNKFQCEGLNETVIKGIADAMATNGMKDAGYQYVVLDDCWQMPDRDKDGNLVADKIKFPSRIAALAEYIHSKGLKIGIYTCAGTKTCGNFPGSRGYEFQDFKLFAQWRIDFVKVDWCHATTQNAQDSYTLISKALQASNRPMILSICEWGLSKPWTWGKEVGHLWRTTGDILNNWDVLDAKDGKVWSGGITVNLDMQKNLEAFAGPGGWNDPDILNVGNGVLTLSEDRAHFSLWCMLAAPIIAGNDLRSMTRETLDILTNKEAVAINQDKLGKQGYKVLDQEYFEIFMKPLSDNDIAICLFNRGPKQQNVVVNWQDYEISKDYSIRNIWKKSDAGLTDKPFKTSIDSHDVVLLRLMKKE